MTDFVMYAGLAAPWLAMFYVMVADEIDYLRSRRHG